MIVRERLDFDDAPAPERQATGPKGGLSQTTWRTCKTRHVIQKLGRSGRSALYAYIVQYTPKMSVNKGELVMMSVMELRLTRLALTDSKESINISLRALQALSSGRQSSTLPPILPGLPESFAQLLSQLRYAITSLSLSFKPPITAPAAIAQLDKVNDHYGRIAACVVAVTGGQTGSVLAEEWKEGVESIGSETLRLLDVFVDATQDEKAGKASSNGASGSKDENPYLVHTGLVWDVIDRLAKDLSATEVQAVGKRWRAQVEVMKDAWSEFKEFLEDQAEDEDDLAEDEGADGEDDFGMDDEFGDLEDMMKGGRMAPEERARAEAVCLLRVSTSWTDNKRQNRCSAYTKYCNLPYLAIFRCWCLIPKNNTPLYLSPIETLPPRSTLPSRPCTLLKTWTRLKNRSRV